MLFLSTVPPDETRHVPFAAVSLMVDYINSLFSAIVVTRVGLRWGMRSELSVKM